MEYDGHLTAAVQCGGCREVVGVNAKAKRPRCPRCRKDLKPPYTSWADWVAYNEEPAFACPLCGITPLVAESLGMWD